jgi:ribosome maturation factor RimP
MGFEPVFYLWIWIMDVAKLVESTLTGMGYELVDIELCGRGLMRILMDKPTGITVDDCELVSNQLTRLFAVEGVNFDRLEVSSPGLDRPLIKESDFIRFCGQQAKLKLRMPLLGRKNFIGKLVAVEKGILQLEVEGKVTEIELSNVDKARLVPLF